MRRRYDEAPMLAKGSIDSVAFAPLDKLAFEPDLLVLVADRTEQTSILLRSLVYKTGEMYVSRSTFVIAEDGTVKRVMHDVKPDTHADDVLGTLRS